MTTIKSPKKLIEVALPLDAINSAAVREKSMRHGHPSTLHLWWARRPLAVARAMIFAQLVNDPGYQQGNGFKYGVNKEKAALERERLFKIIEDLVLWENTNNSDVLKRANEEIMRSWREVCALNQSHSEASNLFNPDKIPALHDPFAGGGAIPLEAQRLGLEVYASDLNPVAVSVNKSMIDVPFRFKEKKPVGPLIGRNDQDRIIEGWSGLQGIAEDVRRYSALFRKKACERLGHLYPEIDIDDDLIKNRPDLEKYAGKRLTIIAYIWARTVKSPNPAFSHLDVPLISSYVLSAKKGRESYLIPIINDNNYHFKVCKGAVPEDLKNGTKLARGAKFKCILSGSPIDPEYIKSEGRNGRMGHKLLALVADGPNGRIYLEATEEDERRASDIPQTWKPEVKLPEDPRNFWTIAYGLTTFGDLFTPRQLFVLNTLSEIVKECIEICKNDCLKSDFPDDDRVLEEGGMGAVAYAQAVGMYLAFQIDQLANHLSTICAWHVNNEQLKNTFARQSIPMTWDYAEVNPLSTSSGSLYNLQERQVKAFVNLAGSTPGIVIQADAQTQQISLNKIVSTDPPYYDNIAYADLSDFFYIWLRRTLRSAFPKLYSTMSVPKSEELVASPHRHGGKNSAEEFFLHGMTTAMTNLAKQVHPAFPVTIYYAFKQSDTSSDNGTSSTGWETFLEAVLKAGFSITGTWPVRTEQTAAMKTGVNALASSIVLVCSKRDSEAPTISRREFMRELNSVLPQALDEMTRSGVNSPVAPVDLSQAIIGPGMAIFSKYSAVLESTGENMSIRTALRLINRYLAEEDFDHDTQFCLQWFENFGWSEAKYGDAEVLARSKGTSVQGLTDSGIVEAIGGRFRLLRWQELKTDWMPEQDLKTSSWEALHQLILELNTQGEVQAGKLLARMPRKIETIRVLAYRLYTLCERKGWAEEARAYNEIIGAWSGMEQAAHESGVLNSQPQLDF